MKKRAYLLGFFLFFIHLTFTILTFGAKNGDGLEWIWLFLIDGPAYVLIDLLLSGNKSPSYLYLINALGCVLWLLLGIGISTLVDRFFKVKNLFYHYISCLFLIIIYIMISAFIHTKYMQFQRVSDQSKKIQTILSGRESNLFKSQIIFDTPDKESISNIQKNPCSTSDSQIIVSTNRNSYYLDSALKVLKSVNLGAYFTKVNWTYDEKKNQCLMLGSYNGFQIIDEDGKKIVRYPLDANKSVSFDQAFFIKNSQKELKIAGVVTYGGLQIYNLQGELHCETKELAMGTAASFKSDLNTQIAIVYTNSNNAPGKTDFTYVDENCQIVQKIQYKTNSSEFAILPSAAGGDFILLTDENLISIINEKGELIRSYEAPGLGTYGKINADIIYKNNSIDLLFVRKATNQDFSALWVFDAHQKIIFQRVDKYDYLPQASFLINHPTQEFLIGDKNQLVLLK